MTRKLPDLVRLYLRNIVIGFAVSALFVAALLWQDVMGLRGLVSGVQGGWIAVAMLFMFNGLVFAGVQFAITIMLMAENDDDGQGGGRRDAIPANDPIPALATVNSKKDR